MIYRFGDIPGTFILKDPRLYNLYFPLTDAGGRLLSAISPGLGGDIKRDNDHFLTQPASIEDLRSSPLCCREFFIKCGNKVLRLSRPYRDVLEAGFLYHKLTKKTAGLEIEILNFIPSDIPAEVMRVRVRNVSSAAVAIEATSFIPLYGRAEKNLRDHRHVSALLNRVSLDKFGISLKPSMIFDEKGHKLNSAIYFCRGFEGSSIAPIGQFPTLDHFYGRGDIFRPDAVFENAAPVRAWEKKDEFDGKESCAALRFSGKRLPPGGSSEYFLILGIEDKEERIERIFRKLNSPDKVERVFRKTGNYWQGYLKNLEFDFRDSDRNGWLSWVKFQPTLRKLFGCSFLPHFDYGKGGRGWRDLWQDGLALLLTEPEKARKLIYSSFAGVRLDGSNATIIAKDNSFLADRNKISRVWMDHGVWPYLTTRSYLDRTADLDFLLSDQVYFRDHQLNRAKAVDSGFSQKDFLQRDTSGKVYRGSILEHLLVQTLVQFFNVGAHNVIRLENADWNDGLDMAGNKGEGCAFSFMYCRNLKNLCELLRALGKHHRKVGFLAELSILLDTLGRPIDYSDHKAKQKLLQKYFDNTFVISGKKILVNIEDLISDLEAKYRHMSKWLAEKEWLPEGFFNGYYDDLSRRVEGRRLGSLRMMLTSQVFAIMSGVASSSQVSYVWKAVKDNLFDRELGGFRLNTDLGKPYMELGRAFGFSYGDKENGAFFSHMNVMLANALYGRGFIKEGREVLESLYKMSSSDKAGIPPVLPEYFNSQGKGLYLYLTGSASWYVHTLVEEILGVKFLLGDILLEPKLTPEDFRAKTIELRMNIRKRRIRITYIRGKRFKSGNHFEISKVCCNGKNVFPCDTGWLINPRLLNAKDNSLKVYLS